MSSIKIALLFHGDGEFIIDFRSRRMVATFIGGGNRKIIDLSLEECVLSIYDTRVNAWFMYRGCHPYILKNWVGVLFPKAWRFRMTLHCRENRYDLTWF